MARALHCMALRAAVAASPVQVARPSLPHGSFNEEVA